MADLDRSIEIWDKLIEEDEEFKEDLERFEIKDELLQLIEWAKELQETKRVLKLRDEEIKKLKKKKKPRKKGEKNVKKT